MCGIVGVVSKEPKGLFPFHGEIFKDLLIADSVRGLDSTGVFGVSLKNELEVVKQAVDPNMFLKGKLAQEWVKQIPNCRLIVGHNRKATTGEISSANAHPFKEGNIVLVHNGGVFDHKALGKETDVDSHALCHAFAAEGAEKTIASVRGMFALVWYNLSEQALYMWRNNDRPLEIFESASDIYFASERRMLNWVLTRDSRVIGDNVSNYRSVPVDTLVKMTFSPWNIETKPLKEKPVPSYSGGNWTKLQGTEHSYPQYNDSRYTDLSGDSDPIDLHWVKHIELAKEQMAEPRESTEDTFTAKEAIGLYPFGTEVLFKYQQLRMYIEKPKRWCIQGQIYLPNKPVFKCYIYTDENVELSQLKKWKDAKKLITTIKTIVRAKDHIVVHGGKLAIPETVATHNGWQYPKLEWQTICKIFKCAKCNSDLEVDNFAGTSVNEKDTRPGEYKIVCSKCTTEAFSKRAKDAVESSDIAVQNC